MPFNAVSNSKDISELATLLGVGEYLLSSKGFTYADNNSRIVFLNEDLSEEERVYVLLHEQGHIFCRHLCEGNILGNDVVQEHEANEFVHFVLYPTLGMLVTELYGINLICENLLAAFYGVALNFCIS